MSVSNSSNDGLIRTETISLTSNYDLSLCPRDDDDDNDDLNEMDVGDFLEIFEDHFSCFVQYAYLGTPQIHKIGGGKLVSSLATEVFSQVDVQLGILNTYLLESHLNCTDAGVTLVIDMADMMINILTNHQYTFRDRFCTDLESCCATANAYFRMCEISEQLTSTGNKLHTMATLHKHRPNFQHLAQSLSELVTLYSTDAVYYAQMTTTFVFQPIEEKLAPCLFDLEWEKDLTYNQVALSITRTIEDFLGDIETYLQNPFLTKKTVDALVQATVVFYTKCLLTKAKEIRNLILKAKEIRTPSMDKRSAPFQEPQKAVRRIFGDIAILKKYFDNLATRMPALSQVIIREFSPLVTITECLATAADSSEEDMNAFIFTLHKHTHDYHQTKHLARDLWYLISPSKALIAFQAVRERKEDLMLMSKDLNTDKSLHERAPPGLSFSNLLVELYGTTKKFQEQLVGECEGACYSRESLLASGKTFAINTRSSIMSKVREMRNKSRDRKQRIMERVRKNKVQKIEKSERALWNMAMETKSVRFDRTMSNRSRCEF